MDFEEVIKDNELEEVSSIELISIMNKVIEVLKERIDDTEEDDFDIELDEMETDELCEFATAVMMVLTGRVEEDADKSEEDDESDEDDEDDEGAENAEDSDEEVKDEDDDDSDDEEDDSDGEDEDVDDEEDEVNESYITEANPLSKASKILSGARDISVLATKADLHKALEKVPSRIKKTAEFADAMKYAKGRKTISPEALERIKNSKLGEWMSNYSEASIKKGNLKPFGGATINPKAPSAKATSVKKSVSATGGRAAGGHGTGGAGGNAAAAGGRSAAAGGHSVSAGGHAAGGNSFSTGGSNVFSQDMPINVHVVNNLKPAKLNGSVSPKVLKQYGVEISELKKAVNDMAAKLPECAAISAKYGSNVAKKFAFWKYLLKIGVPVAALGGGALYVKSLMDDSEKENAPDGSETDTPPVVDNDTPPTPGIPETPENPVDPNNPNNGEEIYIDPSSITTQDGDQSNDKTSNKHSKPKRINYAGLGSIFNDIGSAIDTTGTNIGSGIGTALGGIGR